MIDYVLLAVIAIEATVYGGPLIAGGLFWFHGWKSGSEGLCRTGDVTVLSGLVIDTVLITANFLFGWVDWVAASIA